MEDIPEVPIKYQSHRWQYVAGFQHRRKGREVSHYYFWRTEQLHGPEAIQAYLAGYRAWKLEPY